MNRALTTALATALTSAFAASSASAAVLYSISTTQGSVGNGYDESVVTVTSEAGVIGPTASTFDAGDVGLVVFRNTAPEGFFSFTSNNGDFINTGESATGYLEFTISAAPGLSLDLESLDFDSARGGSSGERGFEVYALVNGEAFDAPNRGDDLVLFVNNESGTRTSPVARSADLSGSEFDDVTTITFRYYPSTSSNGSSIDFNNLELIGTVIPEPASLALLGLGGLCCLGRRRRHA